MRRKSCAFTGHRPQKFSWRYDETDERCVKLSRLGGRDRLPRFPTQPASIHFVSYDYLTDTPLVDGQVKPLGIVEEHCTTVYKVQEAFSSLNLPEGNVYRDALRGSLSGEETR